MRLHQIFGGVAVLAALAAIAPSASMGASSNCQPDGVCVETTDTPENVSPSTASSLRYIAYGVTIKNLQKSTVTHLTMRYQLPSGTTFVSATPSTGTCSHAAGALTCELGRTESGAHRFVEVVVTSPTSAGSIDNTFVASFDERAHDGTQTDPKQDTVSTTETTRVGATTGVASSYVPSGLGVQIGTDPTEAGVATSADRLLGNVAIPARSGALLARLEETPDAGFTCPSGYVCRGGDWLGATVVDAASGARQTFLDPLRFFLRWDETLIARGQNTKNFAVLHADTLSSDPEIVERRCSSATPGSIELPCLWNVRKEKDGDYSAVLITTHNGYMR